MVWSPDSLYVLNIDELKIEKSEEVLRLDWKLESVVKKYSFAVEAKGLEYVATVVGSIDGLSDCYCIGKGRGVCSSQPIYFEVRKGDNKVTASFTAFKQVKEMTMPTRMSTSERETSSEKDAIILILKFIKTDNTVQEATIDVTEIIGTLKMLEQGRMENQPHHRRLSYRLMIRLRLISRKHHRILMEVEEWAAMLMDGDPKIMLSYP